MEWVMIIVSVVTGFATISMAYFAYQTRQNQDRFEKQLSDLYKGIIIATLLSANSDPAQVDSYIGRFKKHYDGETKIF